MLCLKNNTLPGNITVIQIISQHMIKLTYWLNQWNIQILLILRPISIFSGTSNNDPTVRHTHPSGSLGISAAAGPLRLPRPHQNQQDMGIIAKPYSQHDGEPLGTGGLEEPRGSNGFGIYKNTLFYIFRCILQIY